MNLKLIKNVDIKKFAKLIILLVLFWILVGFIILPLINTIKISLKLDNSFTIENYISYFSNIANLEVIKNTFLVGITTVAVCGIIGTILAFYTSLIDIKHKKLIHSILLTPMMIPGVIIVIAFIQLYGESGIITKAIEILFRLKDIPYSFKGFTGIIFVHAYTQYVYFYINVSVALKYLDASTIEAARSLGAGKIRIFFTIILPSILPALLSSSIVTFISGISSFSAPNLIGGRFKVLSTQILLSKANNHMNIASVQVVILLIMGLSMLLQIRYYEKKYAAKASLRMVKLELVRIKNKTKRVIIKLFIFSIVLFIILPILAIIVLSFVKTGSWMIEIFPTKFNLDNYITLISKKRVLQPFINSLAMSSIALALTTVLSLTIAIIVAKRKNKLGSAIEIIAMLPWAMPASTIAINLINTFNVKNIFSFNQTLIGRYWILPIAYTITAIPLMLRTNLIAIYSFNTDLEDASKSLGAGGIKTFFKITLPNIMPAILSGGGIVFIRALGEYTMSALLYGVSNRPISIAMVNAMQEFDIGLSMSYGVITIALSTLISNLFSSNKKSC